MKLGKRAVCWVLLSLALGCKPRLENDPELAPLSLGGDFRLTGSDGRPFSSQTLRGRTVLLFFGYTACPDVCPTTLARLARVYRDLKEKDMDDKVVTVFVSVDPERDSPEKLRQYLSYFAVDAVGLTGKPGEIAQVAQKFGASYERVATSSAAGYLIEHSRYLYLLDPQGRVRHLFRYADPPEEIVRLTARVAEEEECEP